MGAAKPAYLKRLGIIVMVSLGQPPADFARLAHQFPLPQRIGHSPVRPFLFWVPGLIAMPPDRAGLAPSPLRIFGPSLIPAIIRAMFPPRRLRRHHQKCPAAAFAFPLSPFAGRTPPYRMFPQGNP